jgi:hypothetical protein
MHIWLAYLHIGCGDYEENTEKSKVAYASGIGVVPLNRADIAAKHAGNIISVLNNVCEDEKEKEKRLQFQKKGVQ